MSQCHVCSSSRHLPSHISAANFSGAEPSRHAGTQPSTSIPQLINTNTVLRITPAGQAKLGKALQPVLRKGSRRLQYGLSHFPQPCFQHRHLLPPGAALYVGREHSFLSGGDYPHSSGDLAANCQAPIKWEHDFNLLLLLFKTTRKST